MSGILLLFLLGFWLTIVVFIATTISRARAGPRRTAVYWLCVGVLLPLPLLDEIIGQMQFRSLCSDGRVFLTPGSRGKTVQLEQPSPVRVSGMLLPTTRLPFRYKDVQSGEVILAFDILRSRGGLVARGLGLTESKAPFTFRGECHPGGVVDYIRIFEHNGISLFDPLLSK